MSTAKLEPLERVPSRAVIVHHLFVLGVMRRTILRATRHQFLICPLRRVAICSLLAANLWVTHLHHWVKCTCFLKKLQVKGGTILVCGAKCTGPKCTSTPCVRCVGAPGRDCQGAGGTKREGWSERRVKRQSLKKKQHDCGHYLVVSRGCRSPTTWGDFDHGKNNEASMRL